MCGGGQGPARVVRVLCLLGGPDPRRREVAARCGDIDTGKCESDLRHRRWRSCAQSLLTSTTSAIAVAVWGEAGAGPALAEGDATKEDWLESPIFAAGLRPTVSHSELLVSAHEPCILDRIIQPRIAVHASPYLDQLEREVIPSLLDKGLYGHHCTGQFIDIGIPEEYQRSQQFFSQQTKGKP